MNTEDYIGDIRAINALEARVENLDAECIDLHHRIQKLEELIVRLDIDKNPWI